MIFIQILLIPILFLLITGVCFWLIENDKIPRWLQFPPWNCYKCFSTWSLAGVGIMLIILDLFITGASLITLGVLNGIAQHVDEKNKTISINEI